MFTRSQSGCARSVCGLWPTVITALAPATVSPAETATPAVTADPHAPAIFILNAGRTSGYQFVVGDLLHVTHLGLYDWQSDGFQISYPIGIWDEAGDLISLAQIPNGISAPLLDGFRYVEASGPPNAQGSEPTILTPGQVYTIGYFASTIAANDRMITFDGSHQFHSLVTQVGIAVATSGPHPKLTMPTDLNGGGFPYWFGPSFRFDVVPAPAGLLMMAMAGLVPLSRRRSG